MAVKVIGVTTEVDSIGRILGSNKEYEYGLVCETEMGKYYAKFAENGGFQEEYVRLISREQASELEASVVESIENQTQTTATAVPIIDMEHFKKRLIDIERTIKARTEQMGEDIRKILKRAGFQRSSRIM